MSLDPRTFKQNKKVFLTLHHSWTPLDEQSNTSVILSDFLRKLTSLQKLRWQEQHTWGRQIQSALDQILQPRENRPERTANECETRTDCNEAEVTEWQ